MQSSKVDVVVVGGGIAGIMAALWAQSTGKTVTLIERASYCGGLLRSHKNDQGVWFDYGTHIPAMTEIESIDRLLFGEHLNVDWIKFNKLRKGNFFQEVLNVSSQFADITSMPNEAYKKALIELLYTLTTDATAKNLDESLRLHFGNYLTDDIFIPLLKKFYKNPLTELSPHAHRFLEYNRVVAASSEVSKEIKQSPIYDAKFAFAHYMDGGAQANYLYPVTGGCGAWIDALTSFFIDKGGKISLNCGIQTLDVTENSLQLNTGATIEFDYLVWTGPIGTVAKLLVPDIALQAPEFIPTRLYHFTLSHPPKCDCHYVYINDPDMRMFRVTLYPNITGQADDNRVTIETVDRKGVADSIGILSELKQASIYDKECQILSESNEFLSNGFPVITLDALKKNAEANVKLQKFPHVLIGGRGSSDVFFMNDVLKAIAEELEQEFGAPKV